jgi:hypothetical protein
MMRVDRWVGLYFALIAAAWLCLIAICMAYCPSAVADATRRYHIHPTEICRIRAVAVFAMFLWVMSPIGMLLWGRMKVAMRVVFVSAVLLPALLAIPSVLPLIRPWRLW